MSIMHLCYAYGALHGLNMMEVKTQYDAGWITKYELFEAFLQYKGIYGYTNEIITAFRICWELD